MFFNVFSGFVDFKDFNVVFNNIYDMFFNVLGYLCYLVFFNMKGNKFFNFNFMWIINLF